MDRPNDHESGRPPSIASTVACYPPDSVYEQVENSSLWKLSELNLIEIRYILILNYAQITLLPISHYFIVEHLDMLDAL